MLDLSDVTFVMRYKHDSNERMYNIRSIINWLQTDFDTHITLVEQSADSFALKDILGIQHIPFVSENKLIQMTAMNNAALGRVKTPFTAILDADACTRTSSIQKALYLLRSDIADVVYPYRNRFVNVPRHIFEGSSNVVKSVLEGPLSTYPVVSITSVGGLVFASTEKYKASGGDNQKIEGWGYEDVERFSRWNKLGLRVLQGTAQEDILFHLDHPRGINSGYDHEMISMNQAEYEKVFQMPQSQLKAYIRTWSWTQNFKSE